MEKKIKKEVLRYLGYRGQSMDNLMKKTIDEVIDEIKTLIDERYIYKIFNISAYENKIHLEKTDLYLRGKNIKKHLKDSNTCILMAATLGNNVDTRIRYYEKIDMTKALILDAAATAFIEDLCDRICEKIEATFIKDNKKLTNRYSPGYGDLPIDVQNSFLNTLDSQKAIGLTVTPSSILIPRKSVTAIVGIIDKEKRVEEKTCIDCRKYDSCNFKRGGNDCGH
ncbi:MAG: methionine synthase [Tissierella sp.]|uniref:methionine synthase n=1 Tax=Tissierella sp. TaxID=41274 RepID=UPI003F9D6EE0